MNPDIASYRTHLQAGGHPERTVELRVWQLRKLADQVNLRQATTADLARYLAGHGWQPATIYSVRATMRSFYRFMVARRYLLHDPAADLPRVRVHPPMKRPAPEDVIAGAECPDERVQLMVDLAAREGMRRAEIAAVNTSRDLIEDLEGWSLIVHGKGGKDRLVPLHPDIAARLRALPRGWAFPSPNGGHLSPNWVGVLISRALPDGWSAHSLRRRFATRAFDGSRDLRAVQQLLGHSSLSTTQLYIGPRPDSLRAAVDAAA